jgi:DNA (cytosine-5)-methyltransferase 1
MRAIDLFAGAGGFSTGACAAGCDVVWAANHWPAAVAIHQANHPDTEHACQDLQQTDWTTVPAHDLLLASPACQGHSKARGKEKPHHDALRSTAWAVVSAAECHRPQAAIVENVPDFADWTLYPVWLEAMRRLGYAAAPHLIDSADHGVPQHRERLFVVLTLGKHPISLNLPKRAHSPAASVIDFNAGTWTPVEKPGRARATLERIRTARARFGHRFVMPYYGSGSGLTGRCLSRPIGTITTKNRWGVVDGERMRMVLAEESRGFMGFPDDYVLPAGVTEATFMLGNAVCPPVVTDLINALKEAA